MTAERSLADILNEFLRVETPIFLMANEISLPAKSPTKHHVVDIGILEIILKTNRTIANKKSTKVASGTSLTLDLLSTTF